MRRLWLVVATGFAASVAADTLRGADYLFPGFYAAFGFLGCVVIVLVSKWLGKHLLQRAEISDRPERGDG